MTSTITNPITPAIFPTIERAELTELVCGRENVLLARLLPIARRQSVTLDLGTVQRIDAAGIAALICLYSAAREAGNRFTVANPSPRVAEILALVGLERILISHIAPIKSLYGLQYESPAA
jgi:anti-anti-sigma factor